MDHKIHNIIIKIKGEIIIYGTWEILYLYFNYEASRGYFKTLHFC